MRVPIIILASLAAVLAAPKTPQRIVDGQITTIDQYPTIVALLYTWNGVTLTQSCGGTILNNRSILSAAHCTIGDSPSNWYSRIGSSFASSGGTVYASNLIFNHPNYNRINHDSDISILRTTTAIAFSNFAQPASIAGVNYNVADNAVVWAAGWGRTSYLGPSSEQLRHVQIWTVNQAICASRYSAGSVTDNMLCAGWLDVGGRDTCQQDSGGPLYHNGVVVGITSWGGICGSATQPGVYVRVSRYTAWIQANA